MNAIKKMGKRYLNPWKIAGDSLITISTTITGFAIYEKVDWLGYTALGTLAIGKVLLNIGEAIKQN